MLTKILSKIPPSFSSVCLSEGIISHIFRKLDQLPDSNRALLLLVLFSAFLTGALFVARLQADLNFDGEVYISAAMKFESGMYKEGLTIYTMPLYPFLISLMHQIISNWVLAGRLISYFFMALTVIPLYLLSRDLFDRRAAFWSCLTFALLPETLLNSNSVLRDPGFFLFLAWSVYFGQKVIHSKRLVHLFGSASFALASTLFRIEGLIVFPVLFGFMMGMSFTGELQGRGHYKLWLIWGSLFACLIAVILIGAEWHGIPLNRYSDWLAFSDSIKDQSFFENYHRISNQLLQMQETSLNGDVGQHFAETARELMGVIYLIGMLQIFIAVILAVNAIPLVWGFILTRYTARHFFVLICVACLFSFIYGFFIRHDLLIKRYLFMPAVLLCPWIGFGIERILDLVNKYPYPKYLTAFFILVIFTIPAAEFDKYFKNQDDLKSKAASWIVQQAGFKNFKIVFSDQVLKFHADMENEIHGDKSTILHNDPADRNFSKIGRFAVENKIDAIAIYSRTDRKHNISDFIGYKNVKEFRDDNKFINIYVSKER
jgi:4-amino-4-deoxy-L-arabinose transferase-like glycosyltransferase